MSRYLAIHERIVEKHDPTFKGRDNQILEVHSLSQIHRSYRACTTTALNPGRSLHIQASSMCCASIFLDMSKLCHSSRSAGEWDVAEGALAALVSTSMGNEKICRQIIRVGLDEVINAAEDRVEQRKHGTDVPLPHQRPSSRGKHLTAAKRAISLSRPLPTSDADLGAIDPSRGPAVDIQLRRDEVDEISVDGLLNKSAATLSRSIHEEARETCSSLATCLLQNLGPFNYVSTL